MERITAALLAAGRDETVRAVLLTGSGERVFCAGVDVREQPEDGNTARHRERRYIALAARQDAVMDTPKPMIAVLNGTALADGRALEFLWTGDFVSAEEALKIGLVNRVYPDADFAQETLAFAKRLSDGPPLQQRQIKKLMYQSLHTDLRTSLEAVSSHMAVIQSTADYREAISAYKEKRQP